MWVMKCTIKVKVTVFISCLLLLAVPTVVLADEPITLNDTQQSSIIAPRLTYINDAETVLSINNGIATVDCWVNGNVLTATKAKVIAELQLKSGNSWIAYGTWTETANAFTASVYESKSVKTGQTYRVKATYTVWEGSQSETIVVFSDEVTA